MSGQMRCLLDKVTARRIVEGLLKLAETRGLTDDEVFALDLFERAAHDNWRLFIIPLGLGSLATFWASRLS